MTDPAAADRGTADPATVPVVDYLRLGPGGAAVLLGQECTSCRARYTGRRNGCGRCGGSSLAPVELARAGTVDSATTIHRAAPGVPVPYTSVVVDLDGGGSVKANYLGPVPEPLELLLGRRVRLATRSVGVDRRGTEAIGFGFVAEEGR